MIDEIDHDVKIVPRGAYVKSPTGQVSCNRSFEGLDISRSFEPNDSEHIASIVCEEKSNCDDIAAYFIARMIISFQVCL